MINKLVIKVKPVTADENIITIETYTTDDLEPTKEEAIETLKQAIQIMERNHINQDNLPHRAPEQYFGC